MLFGLVRKYDAAAGDVHSSHSYHGTLQVQYLVKWRGLEYSDSTWEDEGELTSEEDQVRAIATLYTLHESPPAPLHLNRG